MATFDLGRVTPLYKGDYNASASYELNDVVLYNGNLYWHVQATATVGILPTDTTVWKLAFSDEGIRAEIRGYADDAQVSKTAAAQSASQASASASNASASASQAASSAQAASTKASEASTSAQTASTKASEASTSAQSAASSAQTATDEATLASQKAAAASESASLATAKASAAATSETNAATSAQTATAKASEAAASATSAQEYDESAQASAVNAQTAQGLAETAQTAAETAQGLAEDARDLAQQYAESIDPEHIYSAFPTDTAEGSIASFADGADDIPLKSLVVNIDPVQSGSGDPSPDNVRPISGWSEVNVKQSGKFNIGVDYNSGDGFVQSAILKADNTTDENPTYFVTAYFPITPDSDCLVDVMGAYNLPAICFYDASKTFISGVSYANRRRFTVHTPSNCAYARMTIYIANAHASGAYDNCTSITIALGQTVYGGSLDVLSGVLTVDRAMVDLGTLSWNYVASTPLNFRASELIGAKAPADASVKPNAICSILPVLDYTSISITSVDGIAIIFATSAQAGKVWAHSGTYTDATAFKSAVTGQTLVYELATPLEIQLDAHAINSLYGVNNLWADSGDTEAEYRADTKLFIERLTAPDSADMIADANITSGSYFMVGNSLYLATANIASGGQVIVGTNCTRKSLATALNEINS